MQLRISLNKLVSQLQTTNNSFINKSGLPEDQSPSPKMQPFNINMSTSQQPPSAIKLTRFLNSSQYENMYTQILSNTTKSYRYTEKEEEEIEKVVVKKHISKSLRLMEKQQDFKEKFLHSFTFKKKPLVQPDKSNPQKFMSMTSHVKQSQVKKSFFANNNKAIGLQEQCMLLEYYLKDQQKTNSRNQYLINLNPGSQHRRLSQSTKDSNHLHKTHDEKKYLSMKKKCLQKEKFIEKCIQIAKSSPAYKRRQNFKKIQFVLEQHNKNLLAETIFHDQNATQASYLINNNKLMRLFLQYEPLWENGDIKNVDNKGYAKFKSDLFEMNGQFLMKEIRINHKILQIVQYKNNNKFQFQDFKELMIYIRQLYDSNIMELFEQKYPQYFTINRDLILNDKYQKIQQYMKDNKIKFLLKIIFSTDPNKLISKTLLPVKHIPAIFKTFKITEKEIQIKNVQFYYRWMQHHDLGITFEQFYKGSILLGMKGNDYKGIQKILKKINIRQYLR